MAINYFVVSPPRSLNAVLWFDLERVFYEHKEDEHMCEGHSIVVHADSMCYVVRMEGQVLPGKQDV